MARLRRVVRHVRRIARRRIAGGLTGGRSVGQRQTLSAGWMTLANGLVLRSKIFGLSQVLIGELVDLLFVQIDQLFFLLFVAVIGVAFLLLQMTTIVNVTTNFDLLKACRGREVDEISINVSLCYKGLFLFFCLDKVAPGKSSRANLPVLESRTVSLVSRMPFGPQTCELVCS